MGNYNIKKAQNLKALVKEYERENTNKENQRNTARSHAMNAMSKAAIKVIQDAEFIKSIHDEDAPTNRDFWYRIFNYTYMYYQNAEKQLIARYAQIYDPTTKYTIIPMPSLIDAWREPIRPIRSR